MPTEIEDSLENIDIIIPSIGESILEVQLLEWLIKDGQVVEKNEELALIESEKATVSIFSPATGRLVHKEKPGSTLKIAQVIALLVPPPKQDKREVKRDVRIPSLGESVLEVELLDWTVKSGDTVKQDQILARVESEKATLDLFSPCHGIIRILKEEKQHIAVGSIVATVLETVSEKIEKKLKPSFSSKVSWHSEQEENTSLKRIAPAAKHMMTRHGIDPCHIQNTNRPNLLSYTDVKNYLEEQTSILLLSEPLPQYKLNVNLKKLKTIIKDYNPVFNYENGIVLSLRSFFVYAMLLTWQKNSPKIEKNQNFDFTFSTEIDSDYGTVYPKIEVSLPLSVVQIVNSLVSLTTDANTCQLAPDKLRNASIILYTNKDHFQNNAFPDKETTLFHIYISSEDEGEILVAYQAKNDANSIGLFVTQLKKYLETPIRLLLEV